MKARMLVLLCALFAVAGGQGGTRVFLEREEEGGRGQQEGGRGQQEGGRGQQEGLVCTSLPGLEPQTENLYFACTCSDQGTKAR